MSEEKKETVSDEMKFLRDILLSHKGKENSITSSEIARQLNISDGETHNIVRAMIKRCAYHYHIPLAAYGYGYYVITSREELKEYCHNLSMRANEISKRREKIEEFFGEWEEAEID